ncbi:tail fiber assembly protein [Kluyvera intermedia]|uniref:tail fiber assembly protein n=1 Tax=Kluyvera intermedia TaxID=61648 RepID=UPI00372D4AF2
MTFKISNEAQTIRIFNLRADTNEFIGAGDAYIAPHTGLPAHCTDVEPPEAVSGTVAVYDLKNGVWNILEDHRGITVYDITSMIPTQLTELGPIPDGFTVISPDGEYQKWNGNSWVKDEEAEKTAKYNETISTKNNLMQVANENILPLQDAVDLDIATDDEKQKLSEWKKFRVMVNRVDLNNPDWPQVP